MSPSSFQPFNQVPPAYAIGLRPLNQKHPLYKDGEQERYLTEKIALYRTVPDDVVQIEPDTTKAQNEVAHLLSSMQPGAADFTDWQAEFSHLGPMAIAALGVQDDLLLMRNSRDGWRLVAASLCFPSSWSLAEKFGHPLERIHAPVPHMAGKTGDRIRRIFDMLRPDTPLWRENWSIEGDDNLRHARKLADQHAGYKAEKLSSTLYIRCEYQTLHKLPVSGDILFTVRIVVRSVPELAHSEEGRAYLEKLVLGVSELSEQGLAYKGLSGNRERLKLLIHEALAASKI